MDCHEKEFGCLCKNVGGHFPCLFHGIYVKYIGILLYTYVFFCFDVSSLVLTLCLNFEIVLLKFVSNYTLVCRNLDLQEYMLIYNILLLLEL